LKYHLKSILKKIIDPAIWILLLSFGISLIALVIYLTDNNYSDAALFFLLTIMRYSSFILCVCALYKLSLNIYRCIRDRRLRLFRLMIYIMFIVYGIFVVLMDAFIVMLSGGNV
jgi:hypothetical protein